MILNGSVDVARACFLDCSTEGKDRLIRNGSTDVARGCFLGSSSEGKDWLLRNGGIDVGQGLFPRLFIRPGERPGEVRLVEGDSEPWSVGQVNEAVLRQRLVGKQAPKVGRDFVSPWTQIDELGYWAVVEGVLKVVGVDAGTVGNDHHVLGCCHGHDASRLRYAADPGDVGLQDVHAARAQQLAEPVAGVLVFPCRQQHAASAQRLTHLR